VKDNLYVIKIKILFNFNNFIMGDNSETPNNYILTNNYVSAIIKAFPGDDVITAAEEDYSFMEFKPEFGKHFTDFFSADISLDMNNKRNIFTKSIDNNIYLLNARLRFRDFLFDIEIGTDFDDGSLLKWGILYNIHDKINLYGSYEIINSRLTEPTLYTGALGLHTSHVIDDNYNKIGLNFELLGWSNGTEFIDGYKISPLLQINIEPTDDKIIKTELGLTIGKIDKDINNDFPTTEIPLVGFYGSILIDNINKVEY
jgi:hypothetical protein